MIKRIEPNDRASRAIEYGGHFVTGGVVADDMSAGIVGQTRIDCRYDLFFQLSPQGSR